MLYHLETLKRELAEMFNRPNRRWSYLEESRLADICRIPDVLNEWAIIKAYRDENRQYFPRSVDSLLAKWDQLLDQAAASKSDTQPKRASLFELKTVLAAKESEATEIRNRHYSEGAYGTWDSAEHRERYAVLRGEIKELRGKIGNFGV